MCALCGVLSTVPHWSTAAPVAERSAASQERLVTFAGRMLDTHHVRLSRFGGRLRVAGPTGRCAIVDDLGALWSALDRMNVPIDPLSPDLLGRTEPSP